MDPYFEASPPILSRLTWNLWGSRLLQKENAVSHRLASSGAFKLISATERMQHVGTGGSFHNQLKLSVLLSTDWQQLKNEKGGEKCFVSGLKMSPVSRGKCPEGRRLSSLSCITSKSSYFARIAVQLASSGYRQSERVSFQYSQCGKIE